MLKEIEWPSKNILGVFAENQITREDYENVLVPLLKNELKKGHKIRMVYQLDENFKGFTAGAAWDDFKIGVEYLNQFDRCAVVSDIDWINRSVKLIATFVPFPVQVFATENLNEALSWVTSYGSDSKLTVDLENDGLLVLKPEGNLNRDDFNKLESVVDPFIESGQKFKGVVIKTEKFPGWKNLGSFLHHVQFVKSHHGVVKRLALATNGKFLTLLGKVSAKLTGVEVKQFPFHCLDEAKDWVRMGNVTIEKFNKHST